MRRSLAFLLGSFAAALVVGGCESPTSVTADLGPIVALDSLRTVDAVPVPCCAVDSAGARVTVVAGTLTFRRYVHFTDTAYTPGGPVSAACVTEVPNGATIYGNGLVTVGDSIAYLVIPCHVGTYTLALSLRLEFTAGSSRTAEVTVSSGTYSWKRDTLSLVDGIGEPVPASMLVDTVIVVARGRRYRFQAVAVH
jgi:hypothetical protein